MLRLKQAAIRPEKSCAFQPGGARDQAALGLMRVVIDLRAVEAAAVDHFEAGVRLAGRGDAACVDEPLFLEPVEGVGDAARAPAPSRAVNAGRPPTPSPS